MLAVQCPSEDPGSTNESWQCARSSDTVRNKHNEVRQEVTEEGHGQHEPQDIPVAHPRPMDETIGTKKKKSEDQELQRDLEAMREMFEQARTRQDNVHCNQRHRAGRTSNGESDPPIEAPEDDH